MTVRIMKRGQKSITDRWKFRLLWESGASTARLMSEFGLSDMQIKNLSQRMKLAPRHPEFSPKDEVRLVARQEPSK